MNQYNSISSDKDFKIALSLVEEKIKNLRENTPNLAFDKDKLAEVEINKFFFNGQTIDRVMVVLRSNGCQHYKINGGCSMCSHLNGSPLKDKIVSDNYIKQWNSLIDGSFLDKGTTEFNINNYPVVCVYNLGSLLNKEEIDVEALKYIFSSLNKYKGIKKVIIESRAEYVTDEALMVIKEVYDGLVEVGIGVESSDYIVRQLCHHKAIEDETIITAAVETLHKYQMKALAYVNFKPVFLTEKEAIDDAILTSIDCIQKYNFDAISIEPTSLQENSLANYLYNLGLYRVPWLWSLKDIIYGIYDKIPNKQLDIRLGGYFDEEVLSGSQGLGFNEKNEIFPHMTSSNCSYCTTSFINAIKNFNMTYDVKDLEMVEECEHCYNLWQASKQVKDSRSIITRIKDILEGKGD